MAFASGLLLALAVLAVAGLWAGVAELLAFESFSKPKHLKSSRLHLFQTEIWHVIWHVPSKRSSKRLFRRRFRGQCFAEAATQKKPFRKPERKRASVILLQAHLKESSIANLVFI